MKVEEYISSGIIESYVLGLASAEDSAEFERMCAAHGQVRDARNAFEIQLEEKISNQSVEPPRELKSRIFSKIGMERDQQAPVIPLKKPALVPRDGFVKYVAAASVILLAGSVLLNFYLISQYKKSIAQYNEVLASQTQYTTNNKILQTKLSDYENTLSLIRNPVMAIVKMQGVPSNPTSLATVYWNTKSKDVYLLVNELPKPAAEKQYQLWAIVDGKPVDAGVFDLGEGVSFMKLKTIPKAEAFAVTLEKRGGSVAPTMTALYVLGKVTG